VATLHGICQKVGSPNTYLLDLEDICVVTNQFGLIHFSENNKKVVKNFVLFEQSEFTKFSLFIVFSVKR
jgi:hypothetical protein